MQRGELQIAGGANGEHELSNLVSERQDARCRKLCGQHSAKPRSVLSAAEHDDD